jgi:cell division protein FtsL
MADAEEQKSFSSVQSPPNERAARESRGKRLRLRLFRSKRVRIALLVLLVLAVLSQIPFIYRRRELGNLRAQIEALKNNRELHFAREDEYRDYRGVIHVHSSLGGHSTGTPRAIITAAQANELHFVVMTEHPAREFDTAALTLNGAHGGVLFIGGSEVAAASGERLLLFPGSVPQTNTIQTANDIMSGERTSGQLRFVAYPSEFRSWESQDYDGIEIYSLFTNARDINLPVMFFDGLWSYGSYPDLLFARFYQRPAASLRQWDEVMRVTRRRIVAVAGVDAHANVGFRVGDMGGHDVFGLLLDPYERSFRVVRTHALLARDRELNAENLLAALRDGHVYFSFDIFSDATGFRFTATNSERQTAMMGDEIALGLEARLRVVAPLESRILLFRDGDVIDEARNTSQHEFIVRQPGIYRVEIYLPQLTIVQDQPWIISNPIYVR